MTDEKSKTSGRRWLYRSARVSGIVLLLLIGMGFVAQRMSDGPTGPIQGGALRTGALVTEPVTDWSFAQGQDLEIQLVEPVGSRRTGLMVHDGELYVPCDLGFMWGRFSGQHRLILHAIYILKSWHEDALLDGRVVLRIAGKRYERQAVRVTDPELVAELQVQLEGMAAEWLAPEVLGPAPTEGPGDIWFFRMDPRASI